MRWCALARGESLFGYISFSPLTPHFALRGVLSAVRVADLALVSLWGLDRPSRVVCRVSFVVHSILSLTPPYRTPCVVFIGVLSAELSPSGRAVRCVQSRASPGLVGFVFVFVCHMFACSTCVWFCEQFYSASQTNGWIRMGFVR